MKNYVIVAFILLFGFIISMGMIILFPESMSDQQAVNSLWISCIMGIAGGLMLKYGQKIPT